MLFIILKTAGELQHLRMLKLLFAGLDMKTEIILLNWTEIWT